ncbi:MAG: thioesterase family protein [Acidimicrobiales bacterium]
MPGALYSLDGDRMVPGPLTVGPWYPDAQHGGPVAALLARAVESAPAPTAMQVVRLTVELVRPVPLRPLHVSSAVTRPGRKVQIVDAALSCDGTEVARARALRIRDADTALPAQDPDPVSPAPPVGDAVALPPIGSTRTAFIEAVDLRFVKGSWEEPGPVTMWSRLLVPVVDGEKVSPLQRTAAAADFGNGVSRIVDFETHLFINPDLTVALSRLPEGEWIGFDVVSRLSGRGYGQAESLIFDPIGPVGRAVQSVLVERR